MISKDEIKELLIKDDLTQDELDQLIAWEDNTGQNRLYSFFTPLWLCDVMYRLAIRNGFNEKTGKVLETSAGNGNFVATIKDPTNLTVFELDPINFQIIEKRVPTVKYRYNQYFETAFLDPNRKYRSHLKDRLTWLKDYPFDLVIGNPPYRKYQNRYSGFFKKMKFKQTEQFFMYKSLELLKKGGLLVFITASGFLRSETEYKHEKQLIGQLADLVDAYRMPKVFKNTDAPTDILIFRRK